MMSNLRLVSWRASMFGGILIAGAIALNSCSSSPTQTAQPQASMAAGSVASKNTVESDTSNPSNSKDSPATTGQPSSAPVPQKPQLIKTVDMSMRLESIDKAVVQIRKIVQGQQGDIYSFQDDRNPENSRRQASLVLKVSAATLDDTLAAIAKLGQIQGQSIRSEDVTRQLVDTDARLKNLRQQEDLTRKIMERSGSIKDVLVVSKELATIREQIEQLDATVKSLRQQVAYSTINLKVEEIQSTSPSSDPLGVRVQETWKNSTNAASGLATNLALTLLWLLPFSPFLALGAGGFYFYRRRRKPQPAVAAPTGNEGEP